MHAENGQMVIALYRPKAGNEEGCLAEIRQHLPALRRLGRANLLRLGSDSHLALESEPGSLHFRTSR